MERIYQSPITIGSRNEFQFDPPNSLQYSKHKTILASKPPAYKYNVRLGRHINDNIKGFDLKAGTNHMPMESHSLPDLHSKVSKTF